MTRRERDLELLANANRGGLSYSWKRHGDLEDLAVSELWSKRMIYPDGFLCRIARGAVSERCLNCRDIEWGVRLCSRTSTFMYLKNVKELLIYWAFVCGKDSSKSVPVFVCLFFFWWCKKNWPRVWYCTFCLSGFFHPCSFQVILMRVACHSSEMTFFFLKKKVFKWH